MIDRDKLAREAIDLNKQIAKLEVRSRKLTNALDVRMMKQLSYT